MENIEKCELLQGDCLELIKNITDGSVDLTVTSPPYDNLRTYNGNIRQWNFEKFKDIAKELYRVTADGGVVVWIVADATIKGSETGTSFRQVLWFMDCGFNLHDTMIWHKISPFQHKNRYIPSFEYMFIFSKGKPRTANIICDRKNKKAGQVINSTGRQPDGTTKKFSGTKNKRKIKEYGQRHNVWDMFGVQSQKERTGHPAQFPEQLANDHIISWSNKGDTVLDCFMGSGTTGKMAVLNNRNFIGIELDKGYFDIAEKRINEAIKGGANG